MPQLVVIGPLREAYLRHELGPHPVWTFVRRQARRERRLGDLARLQQAPYSRELRAVEACSRVTDINQSAVGGRRSTVTFVHAQQQRAEVLARLPRFGPSADHELLFAKNLELVPRRAALAGLVDRLRLLGDQALPLFGLRARLERAAVADGLFAQTDRL